jgi:hypothetical protein
LVIKQHPIPLVALNFKGEIYEMFRVAKKRDQEG